MSTQTNTVFDIDGIDAQDDLGVALDPATYQDAQPSMPIFRGIYGSLLKDFDLVRDKDTGDIIFRDGYPTLLLRQVEVVDGVERPRPVYLYQRINIKPRERKNFTTGETSRVSDLADLIRSADATATFSGWKEALGVLQSLVAQGQKFYHKLDWEASDRDAIKEKVDAIKADADDEFSAETKKAVAEVYKAHTRRGQSKFKAANGKGYVPFMDAEDGSRIDARVVIPMDGFISQATLDKVKIGPSIKAVA